MRPSKKEKPASWLLLLFRLPATHKSERVAVWRKLKKSGAIQIQTSTYLLPDEAARYEYFQWLSKETRTRQPRSSVRVKLKVRQTKSWSSSLIKHAIRSMPFCGKPFVL